MRLRCSGGGAARLVLLSLLAMLMGAGVGCAAVVPPAPQPSDSVSATMTGDPTRPEAAGWLRTELFFATGRADDPSASSLDAAAWRAFLDEDVTPLFPDGFTVLDGYGQWRSRDGERIGRLLTKVMIILHPDDAIARDRVEAVRIAFKRRTGQDSVLRATGAIEVSF